MRSSLMSLKFVLAAAAAVGLPALAAACSSSGVDLLPPSECSRGGQTCQFACDPNRGCVECGADSDCGAAAPFCVAGKCDVCAVSADCGTGKACFPREHTCEPACTGNASCTEQAPLCDPASGACVGCVGASDCPATKPICDPTFARCAECAGDGDCGAAAPICDLGAGECVQCLIDSQCGSGGTCHDHHCEKGCMSNADCGGDKPLCRTDGQCVECLAASDCGAAAPFCSDGGACVVCRTSSDCTNPALPFCDDGGAACVQCRNNDDCGSGLQCKDKQCVAK